jgi:hypothetical protein
MPCQPGTPVTQVSGAGRLLEPHTIQRHRILGGVIYE